MPKMEPILPPMMATIKRVASGIRKAPFMALRLSMPMRAKPSRFTMIKYDTIIKITSILSTFYQGNKDYLLFFSTSNFFMARTFKDRPNRLMKPSASWWS